MNLNDFRKNIKDQLEAYKYNYLGKSPKTSIERAEFERLVKKGLINKSRFDFFKFVFALGKGASVLGRGQVQSWTRASIVNFLESEVGKLTRVEEASLEFIKAEAEDRVAALFETIGASIQSNYKNRILGGPDFERVVRESLERKITDRKVLRQMASDIGKQTGAWGRDLYRIAFTESYNAYEFGVSFGYMKKTGKKANEITVAKIPRGIGISCKDCLKHYLKGSSNEPKLFKLSEIIGNSNVGRKRKDWVPCVSALHPYCQCRLVIVYPEQRWNSVMKRFEYPRNK